jgi:hypothetical protein
MGLLTGSSYAESSEETEKKTNETMKSVSKILKIVERRYKFELSKLYRVKHDGTNPFMFMVIGSNKWIRSPHMISLYLLLIRLGIAFYKIADKDTSNAINTYDKLIKWIDKNQNDIKNRAPYVLTSYKYWGILLSNFDHLFKGIKMKDAYARKNYNNCSIDVEGIDRLCHGGSNFDELQKRFDKLLENA